MKKIIITLSFLAIALLAAGHAHAQTPTPITVGGAADNSGGIGLPGTHDPNTQGPVALIANLYDFALAAGGILAFGSILFGAVMYIANPGNHESQSSAKARIRDAFIGLLLLLGIYMILHLINPGLTKLQFPILQRLAPPAPSTSFDPSKPVYTCKTADGNVSGSYPDNSCGGKCSAAVTVPPAPAGICVRSAVADTVGPINTSSMNCQQWLSLHPGGSCNPSPALSQVTSCIDKLFGKHVADTTTAGTHSKNSCHFGGGASGSACLDGGHAVDYGLNTAAIANKTTLLDLYNKATQCSSGHAVACYYESNISGPQQRHPDGDTSRWYSWNDPRVTHIHCNVDNASCGCN